MTTRCLPGVRACLLSTATALALCAAPAVAQEAKENVFQMLGRIIFGTGTAKVAIDTPQAVTALEQDDLDRKQADNIGEMLKGVPGVQAAGASARPMGMAFNIRGIGNSEQTASEERIKVVVDGAPKFFEQYRMGSFFGDLELFKRVEILRGPASSTLYGSGTIGGVVAFTTKDAADYLGEGETSALRFKGGYESNGDVTKLGVIYAHRVGNADFLLALNQSHGGDKTDGAGDVIAGTAHEAVSGLAKGTLTFGNDGDQTLTLALSRTDTNLDDAAVAQTGGATNIPTFGFADIHAIDDTATLTWRNEFSANDLLDLTVQLSYTETDVSKDNFTGSPISCAPGTFQVLCPGDFGYATTALKIENTADLSAGDWQNFLTFGVQLSEQKRTATSSLGPLGFHPEGTDKKVGVYAQGEFVWNERLTLIPGLRVDFGDRTPSAATAALGGTAVEDTAVSPKLSALYKLNDSWGVFGTIARTERMPTLDEHYSTDGGRQPSLDLKKEAANSIELGVTFQREGLFAEGDSLNVKATAFHSNLSNLIVTNSATGAVPRYLNVRSSEIWGTELDAAYDAERWFASLGYSNTNSAYRRMPVFAGQPSADGLTLADTPGENVSLTVGAKFPDRGVVVGWTAYYYDAITTNSVSTSTGVITPTYTPAYATHDLFVTWKPEDGALAGMDVTLTVENVFDADYKNNLSLDRAQGMNAKLSIGKNFTW
ncbi:TonB-dependent receptor [Tabrizicola sp.]|uniref:TonB-dependent receptor domain-containing protein n=1 Tax=Tabrizicola sp. TaxID=2005166 RepID=UPI001A4DA9E2|nr:TonB-dependent receptor [Tabrizicola sp.]MBL9063194.1 TonB-dependent receptor [Tabrizicola sp.]